MICDKVNELICAGGKKPPCTQQVRNLCYKVI